MNPLQIFLAAKGTDAVVVTATEAIRTLLGFGDRLRGLSRHHVLEVDGVVGTPALDELFGYLARTFELWNPNKERCWVRTGDGRWEVVPGRPPQPLERVPGVEDPEHDHLVLWPRPERELRAGDADSDPEGDGPETGVGAPRDFPVRAGGRPIRTFRGEVYGFLWSDGPKAEERVRRLLAAGPVRNRGEGLLVQPQYQAHRVLPGPLPLPLWDTPAAAHASEK